MYLPIIFLLIASAYCAGGCLKQPKTIFFLRKMRIISAKGEPRAKPAYFYNNCLSTAAKPLCMNIQQICDEGAQHKKSITFILTRENMFERTQKIIRNFKNYLSAGSLLKAYIYQIICRLTF